MRLPASVALRLVRAAVIFWVGVRLLALILGMGPVTPFARVAVVVLVLVLAHLDVRATNESYLYANLAIGPRVVFGVVLVVAVALEVALTLALRAGLVPTFTGPPF